ncbi:hypothetical protein AGABI1DRAFT_39307 [Agaricus bisporus var. burnettii JB137-S8]|uniref:DUF1640 domain-containing protein n=1 Tax=Agaricus bisporus var. burnettii (strain JB137-S8 / ATCC MYA-4627 / FGSC 10392) TaxID=597362 RepID=K5W0M6_AGABU|nr:uncharacterized protein AGABI1DRAFT_39307 [Agaricus bisporus var. burnettii JB137-S8]EKM80349.1 hypothetical protein AGABI1DRAFT_39307 [Agaricus bisporus var. burnettii JB137-S8]
MFSQSAVRLAGRLRSDNVLARHVHVSRSIRDPFPSADGGSQPVSLSHPLDPSNSASSTTGPGPSSSNSPPRNNTPASSSSNEPSVNSSVPTPYVYPTQTRPAYTNPPFDTYAFFKALEKSFPTPTAQSLMRATRALLVNRIGKVRTEALSVKDLDNQAYLFRAALSELRAELSMNIKNESAAVSSATATLRQDVERLDVKMKEDIDNLKHEIQMELDSRKNESKADFKQQDIAIEELLNKAIVAISDLRTVVEEIKWENMRRAVLTLAAFVVVTIIGMEIRPKPKPNCPPVPKETSFVETAETAERP